MKMAGIVKLLREIELLEPVIKRFQARDLTTCMSSYTWRKALQTELSILEHHLSFGSQYFETIQIDIYLKY